MRVRVRCLALLSGLGIRCYHELWCRLQMWLGYGVAVAVVYAVAMARKSKKKKKKRQKGTHKPKS